MQGTQVRFLVWEDSICHGVTKAVATTIEPVLHSHEPQLLSRGAATAEACAPRAPAMREHHNQRAALTPRKEKPSWARAQLSLK